MASFTSVNSPGKDGSRSTRPLHVAVVTETYPPEINGVATTIAVMVGGLLARGHKVEVVRPRQSADVGTAGSGLCDEVLVGGLPIPGYSSLRFGMPSAGRLIKRRRVVRPDVVQVVTEGPLGWSAVCAARKLRIPCASDFHTNFHAYTSHYRAGWLYRPIAGYLRSMHNATAVTMVPTQELAECLSSFGFDRVAVVSRGVDTAHFQSTISLTNDDKPAAANSPWYHRCARMFCARLWSQIGLESRTWHREAR
jgi:glycosyltransferase involved in cell wall biosynthesis